jgi:uncharacterized protein involved in exopolysaccharide biosynthesis
MEHATAIVPVTSSPPSDLSLRTAVEGFFRQSWFFLLTALIVLLLTAVAILVTHKQYLSQMAFLVQNTRENVVVSAQRTSPPIVSSDVSEEQVNSQVEILRSHDVIDPVADPEWAGLDPRRRTSEALRQHEKLVAKFEKKLDTEIVRKTDVIDVSFLADSPEDARNTLERLSASYLAELRRLQRPEGASEFFASEANRTRRAWDAATDNLVKFQQSHQLVSLPDHEAAIDSEIMDDQQDLFETQATLRELDAQLKAGAQQIADLPSRQMSQETVSANQDLLQQLNVLLVQTENKRTDLATNYKPSDRLVRDLDQQIQTTEKALAKAQAVPTKQQTTDIDPAWQQVRTAYVQNQIAFQAAEQHRAALRSRITELTQDLAGLESTTAQFDQLQARAEELKENYQLYAQKRDQAEIEDAMDDHKLLNVAVAQQPTLSYDPERPKPLLYGALGFVSAMFLGLCAVYFAETSRRSVATPRELDALSRYPVLATVPYMGSGSAHIRGSGPLALDAGSIEGPSLSRNEQPSHRKNGSDS